MSVKMHLFSENAFFQAFYEIESEKAVNKSGYEVSNLVNKIIIQEPLKDLYLRISESCCLRETLY